MWGGGLCSSGWQWRVEEVKGGGTPQNIFILQSECTKEEKCAPRQLLTLHSQPLSAELPLFIVIMYLYNAAKWRNLFHIHLHKAELYCLRVGSRHRHTNTDEIVKHSPPIATPNPATHPAFNADSLAHLSLLITKKQGTICCSFCKRNHLLCHLQCTHGRWHMHLHSLNAHMRICPRRRSQLKTTTKLRSSSANDSQMMKGKCFFFFPPYDFLFYFDVWNGCDQRGLTSPLLSFFYSPQYNAVSSTPPPTVTENTHPRQAQTVPSRLLILDLRVCLAGFVFQENDAF